VVEVNPSSDSTVQGCAEALETLVRDAGGPEGLARGEDVRIFTARVNPQRGQVNAMRARRVIEAWCKRHLRRVLPITHEKDWDMTLRRYSSSG